MQLEETDYFAWSQKMENYYGNANSEPRQLQAPLFSTTGKYLFLPTPYVLSTEKQVSKFGKTIL